MRAGALGPPQLSPEQAEARSRKYYYWLLLALMFEYARPASFFPFLRIPFLYSLIPLALLVAQHFGQGLRPYREIFLDKHAKWPIAIVVMIGLGMIYADLQRPAYTTFILVLGFVFFFIMVARIVTTLSRLRGVIAVLLISHLFLLAMNPNVVLNPTLRQYILGATFLGDGNDFALSLCILLPLAIELAMSTKTWTKRLLCWGVVAILLLGVIATQSRGASLGVAGLMVFLWFFSPRKVLGLVGVVLAGIVVLIYAPPEYFNRMNTISSYQEDGSAQGRIEAWKSSINMAIDNPLLGVGAGNFPTSFGTKYRTPGAANMPWLTAHSSYFLLLGELGFPGLFFLLMLVIGNIVSNMKLRRMLLARAGPHPSAEKRESARVLFLTAGALLGFGIAGTFLSAAYYPHIYVLSGLLIATRGIVMRREGIDISRLSKPRKALQRKAPTTPPAIDTKPSAPAVPSVQQRLGR
jgi:probable O-glycosylation ligase (exosortase A-associated)